MELEIGNIYVHTYNGRHIKPLFNITDDTFICLIGYDSNSIHHDRLTQVSFDPYDLSMGLYDDILTVYQKQLNTAWIKADNFTPILSLKNFNINELKLEVDKCYYNDKTKQTIKIVSSYKNHFLYGYDNLIVFDINTYKIYNNIELYPYSFDYKIISNFNEDDEWIEVPNFYYDISNGKYGVTYNEINRALLNYLRKDKLEKLLCK